MHTLNWIKPCIRVGGWVLLVYLGLLILLYLSQRSMLYHPAHGPRSTLLKPWVDAGQTIGFCREVPGAQTIWLMMHGNAGQAASRDYVLPLLSDRDALYVLEYPGYGQRPGNPSLASINRAAADAYTGLRARHPGVPLCVVGESLGSGPACSLASVAPAPDKIVLLVPYDRLANVAASRFPMFPVRWMLRDAWDNVDALRHYSGPVDIVAAVDDEIIPFNLAKSLASAVPAATFIEISGGHNDWSRNGIVRLKR